MRAYHNSVDLVIYVLQQYWKKEIERHGGKVANTVPGNKSSSHLCDASTY